MCRRGEVGLARGLVVCLLVATAVHVEATNLPQLWVGPNGTPGSCAAATTAAAACSNVTDAVVRVAAAGGTVWLLAGSVVMSGRVTVAAIATVQMRGQGAAVSTIACKKGMSPFNVYGAIEVLDMTISGCGELNAAVKGGVALVQDTGKLNVTRSTFTSHSAGYGGIVFAAGRATIVFDRTTVTNCRAAVSGGAIAAGPRAVVRLRNSIFTSCTAQTGGVLHAADCTTLQCTTPNSSAASTSGWISIQGGSFSANRATVDGGVIAVTVQLQNVSVQSAGFSSNTATMHGGILFFGISFATPLAWNMSTVLTGGYLSSSAASGGNGGAVFASMPRGFTLTLMNTMIQRNFAGGSGGGLFLTGEMAASFSSAAITGCTASNGGGVFASGTVSLAAEGTRWSQNGMPSGIWGSGGGLYAAASAQLRLTTCAFVSNVAGHGGALLMTDSSTVTGSANSFRSNAAHDSGAAIALIGDALVDLGASVFSSNTAKIGGAVAMWDTSDLILRSASFVRNQAMRGGCLAATDSARINGSSWSAVANQAQVGGGLHLSLASATKLQSSSIQQSYANMSGGAVYATDKAILTAKLVTVTLSTAGSSGGGMFLESSASVTTTDVTIQNCSATNGGGLWMQDTAGVVVQGNFWVQHNTAMTGAGMSMDVHSSRFSVPLPSRCTISGNKGWESGGAVYYRLGQLRSPTAASGISAGQESRCSMFNNSAGIAGANTGTSPAEIHIDSSQISQGSLQVILRDGYHRSLSGSSIPTVIQLQNVATGVGLKGYGNGAVAFPTLLSTMPAGPETALTLQVNVLEPPGLSPFTTTVSIPSCISGSVLDKTAGKCIPCPVGTFSMDGSDTMCSPCPALAACPGGNATVALQGTWRYQGNSPFADKFIFVPCDNPAVCLGATSLVSATPGMERCQSGVRSPLCGACGSGSAHRDMLTCDACPTVPVTAGIVGVVGVVGIAVGVLLIWRQRRLDLNSGARDMVLFVLKVVISYSQIAVMARQLRVAWPVPVQIVFDVLTAISSGGMSPQFIVQCFVVQQWIAPHEGTQAVVTILAFVLAVPAMVCGIAVLWSIVIAFRAYCWRRENRTRAELYHIGWVQSLIAFIVFSYLLFPMVSTTVLSLFACAPIVEGRGDVPDFWAPAPFVTCFTGQWLYAMYRIGIPALVVIVVGIPCVLYGMLLRSRRSWLRDPELQEKYGFLFVPYPPECYYWELAILLRKLALILAVSLLYRFGLFIQTTACLAVIAASIVLHSWAKPFWELGLENLEKLSLTAAFLTFALASLLAGSPSFVMQVIVSAAVVTANVGVIGYAVFSVMSSGTTERRRSTRATVDWVRAIRSETGGSGRSFQHNPMIEIEMQSPKSKSAIRQSSLKRSVG